MNGNIDEWLDITAGNTVTVTGWIDFEATDPDSVEVWVGIGQGDKKNATAVYGEGRVQVDRPAPTAGKRTSWQCPAQIENGAGGFKNGAADAGAVVIDDAVEPYPWGRQVKLKN